MSPLLTTVNLGRAMVLTLTISSCALYSCLTSIGAQAADSPAAVTAKNSDPAQTTKAVKVKEDLPNFHQVHPYLFRSGEPSKEGLKKIKEMGITTIFDLRNPGEMSYSEKDAAKELGIRYISMPMNSKAPTSKQIKRLVEEIDKAKASVAEVTEPEKADKIAKEETAHLDKNTKVGTPKQAVLVHCAHGSDRTGCMIGIWRVMRDGYDYDTAYKEMRKYWFTPKFTNLSGAVRTAAGQKSQ